MEKKKILVVQTPDFSEINTSSVKDIINLAKKI